MAAQEGAPPDNGILDRVLSTASDAADSFFDFRLAETRLEANQAANRSARNRGNVGRTPFPNNDAGRSEPRTVRAGSSGLLVPALIVGGVLLATRSSK